MQTTTSKAVGYWVALGLLLTLITVTGSLLSRTSSMDDAAPPDEGQVGSAPNAPDGSPPDGTPNSGHTGVFDEADQRMSDMVATRAKWHAPARSPVAETIEVGLSIGNGEELRRQVEATLPDTPIQPGVPLRIGTDVSARLVGEPSDVSITPSDAIDASTGSDIALLWTWNIHPKHPAERLRLSAHLAMTVPGTDHKLTRTLHLYLDVTRTVSYTAHQIFTNYGTWAAIAVATFGAVAWLRRNLGGAGKKQDPYVPRQPTQHHSAPARRGAPAGAKKRKDNRDPQDGHSVGSGAAPGSSTPRGRPQR